MADKKSHLKLVASTDLKQSLQESIDMLNEPPAPCEGEGLLVVDEMDPEMAKALLEAAGFEVVDGDCSAEVIDFEVERASRLNMDNAEVRPETILKMALEDVTTGPYRDGRCTKAYITLVLEDGKTYSTCNYRANLSKIEEVAFRQLGVTEAVSGWRGGE
jgi:hypothetical protein